jgi:2-polyprenyl-3-methyl-5-hydroxy-6-metoxy-1,4-benzoquinol methylase
MENKFEERYRTGDLPWDHNMVDFNLVETVSKSGIEPCKVLDIGCGTGDNSIWMAEQGFSVIACDFSETAIKIATEKAARKGVSCQFLVADFLIDEISSSPFGFIYDRGCLHCIDDFSEKSAFAEKVSNLLGPGGLWLSLVGNADESKRDEGPPQLSAAELVSIVEPFFEIISLTSGLFGSDQEAPPRAWICLLRKRERT